MAVSVGPGAYASWVSNNGSTNTYFFYSDWTGNDTHEVIVDRSFFLNGSLANNFTTDVSTATGFWYSSLTSNPSGIAMDVLINWYPAMKIPGLGGYINGATRSFVSYVIAATSNTPTIGSITQSDASVSVTYTPNVSYSNASAQLQYKRTVDSTWTNFGTPTTTKGFVPVVVTGVALTGLSALTSYDVRLVITRTTSANTSTTSTVASFTTLPGTPTVTTDSVSTVTAHSATLNATVAVNAGTNTFVYWNWGTDNPPTENTTATQPVAADGSFTQGISGLLASTPYFAQAFTVFNTPSGSPTSGAVVTFTTAADPLAAAANEDHMHIYEYDGIYGHDKTVYFTLQAPASSSSDRLVTTAPGSLFASGDIKVSIDGGAFANVANSVTQVAASNPLYSLVLDDTTEMIGEDILVQIVDQDSPAFRDAFIHVRTKIKTGQIVVSADAITNGTAVSFTGNGSGHGLSAVGGATGMDIDGVLGQHSARHSTAQAGAAGTITLDTSASATNDYYNGMVILIVSGTGAGQSRVITDYVGASKVATVGKAWATNPDATSEFVIIPGDDTWSTAPGAELAALPTFASSYADMLQFLFQRFAYKRTQTATTFTMTKADSTTALATAGVSDNGTTETHNKLS